MNEAHENQCLELESDKTCNREAVNKGEASADFEIASQREMVFFRRMLFLMSAVAVVALLTAAAALFLALSATKGGQPENAPRPNGPPGFNGFQGSIGPAGPPGFNGTQGSRGIMGLRGFNGSQGAEGPTGPQGAQGAGNFSQCLHKTSLTTGGQDKVTNNSPPMPVTVILEELSGKRIVVVTCSTDIAQKYLLSTAINPANGHLFYYCKCYGHYGTGTKTVKCIMHYWECPVTT